MMQDTVQHCCCQKGISHHLSPVDNLLVCREDDRGSFVGIADKGEEPVCLAAGARRISDLIDDEKLSLFQVPEPEVGRTFCLSCIKDLYEADHLLKHTVYPLLMAWSPSPVATMVFPSPGGPANTRLPPLSSHESSFSLSSCACVMPDSSSSGSNSSKGRILGGKCAAE